MHIHIIYTSVKSVHVVEYFWKHIMNDNTMAIFGELVGYFLFPSLVIYGKGMRVDLVVFTYVPPPLRLPISIAKNI